MAQDAKSRLTTTQIGSHTADRSSWALLAPLADILTAVPDVAETVFSEPVDSQMGLSLDPLGHGGTAACSYGTRGTTACSCGTRHTPTPPRGRSSSTGARSTTTAITRSSQPPTFPRQNPGHPHARMGHGAFCGTRNGGVRLQRNRAHLIPPVPRRPAPAKPGRRRSSTANPNVTSGLTRRQARRGPPLNLPTPRRPHRVMTRPRRERHVRERRVLAAG